MAARAARRTRARAVAVAAWATAVAAAAWYGPTHGTPGGPHQPVRPSQSVSPPPTTPGTWSDR